MITPGGIAEMFEIRSDKEVLFFKSRRGYLRLALETGTTLIPVYHFGHNQIFWFGPRCLQMLSRKIRMAIGCLRGAYGLPVPNQVSILTAFGPPIQVERMSKHQTGFEERVAKLQKEVQHETLKLFDKYKASFHPSWSTKPLEFV